MHIAGTSLAGIEANAAGHGRSWATSRRLGGTRRPRPGRDRGGRARTCRRVLLRAGDRRRRRLRAARGLPRGGARDLSRDRRAVRRRRGDHRIRADRRLVRELRWDLGPDIVTCAKGITSGYLPMGAVIAAPWIAEPFWRKGAGMWRHGYTYSGHATAAAAALANLDIMERESLPKRASSSRATSPRRSRRSPSTRSSAGAFRHRGARGGAVRRRRARGRADAAWPGGRREPAERDPHAGARDRRAADLAAARDRRGRAERAREGLRSALDAASRATSGTSDRTRRSLARPGCRS